MTQPAVQGFTYCNKLFNEERISREKGENYRRSASQEKRERTTVGRRNWLFADTPQGARSSAIAYTMVEMARAYDLNIYEYLKYILEKQPGKDWTDEQLETIAPPEQHREEHMRKCKEENGVKCSIYPKTISENGVKYSNTRKPLKAVE